MLGNVSAAMAQTVTRVRYALGCQSPTVLPSGSVEERFIERLGLAGVVAANLEANDRVPHVLGLLPLVTEFSRGLPGATPVAAPG
jgi:hypothetical protein